MQSPISAAEGKATSQQTSDFLPMGKLNKRAKAPPLPHQKLEHQEKVWVCRFGYNAHQF